MVELAGLFVFFGIPTAIVWVYKYEAANAPYKGYDSALKKIPWSELGNY